MNRKNTLLTSAVAAAISIGVAATPISSVIAAEKAIKCYGVAKAGKNDCGTAKHACAGQATSNYLPEEWKFMTKKACAEAKKKLEKKR